MPAIFGHLAPGSNSERQADHDAYTASQGAEHGLTIEGVEIQLLGHPIWRGNAIADSDKSRIGEIVACFRDKGSRLLDDLEGAFAIALVDRAAKRAMLAVDRLGIERLTYAANNTQLVFGTSANAVANFPGFDTSLNDQALFNFLFMHMVPAPDTAYRAVHKLPLATVLEFNNGDTNFRRYWEPNYDYATTNDFEALRETLHQGLGRAVSDSGVDDRTGAFLSGGLDSSTVAGTLAAHADSEVRTFTVGFGEAVEFDELEFSRIANRHFGCQGIEYQMAPADIVDAFPRIAEVYDEPFGNSSAAPTYFCAKLAADNGVDHLLAGDGGDELFGGNERYVRQSIFEIYGKAPSFLRRGLIEPMTRVISPESRIMPLRKLRSYVDQAMIPLPERFESWNFMYREGRDMMLDPDFASAIDEDGPMKLMREVWESAPSDDLLDRMLWYDWHFTLADNDLRKVGTMCELAGVRVSYPMLHPDVVNLSTRVPSAMKIRGHELRTFFKQAMADFLPEEILRKKKHGFGLPFGLWLKTDTDLADLIYSSLFDLKKRHIIAAAFIDNLIEQHREGHPSYFGYAIWDLAMLEAWLATHID